MTVSKEAAVRNPIVENGEQQGRGFSVLVAS